MRHWGANIFVCSVLLLFYDPAQEVIVQAIFLHLTSTILKLLTIGNKYF